MSFEHFYAAVIVAVLVGMAGFYAWRQWRALRRLPNQENLHPADRGYQRAQAVRRLVGCVLMLVLAGLLLGSYLAGQESVATALGTPGAVTDEGGQRKPSAEQLQFLHRYEAFWTAFCVVCLALLVLAYLDLRATRRFWLRSYRQIQDDRRAMIERQVARLRSERNGH